jgi:hypothetical protein
VIRWGQPCSKTVAPLHMDPLLAEFDCQFARLYAESRQFILAVPPAILFEKASHNAGTFDDLSIGESILRSAANVEMAFGGITTRLWDDPFEWTLPEELSTPEKIAGYLDEVEATRVNGFGFFTSDSDLERSLPAPREMRTIAAILLDTLGKANHYQGRAFALFQAKTGQKLPVRLKL